MGEVFGTAYYETARDKLKALLDTLQTEMASDDPTFTSVHERHDVPNLVVNSVSIALDIAETVSGGWSGTTKTVAHIMQFSLRVHTSLTPYGIRDDQKNARLLNSLLNKMKQNVNLGDSYIISDIDSIVPNEEFSESESFGGAMMITVKRGVVHTQD